MNDSIFISYRNNGGEFVGKMLYDSLRERKYKVFFATETMEAGRFDKQIYNMIDACDDFLLVLSNGTLDRCNDPDDWVKKEILYAMKKKKNIIPILLKGFNWPVSICDEIDEIRFYEGVKVHLELWDATVNKICRYLRCSPEIYYDKINNKNDLFKKIIKYEEYFSWVYDDEWSEKLFYNTDNYRLWKSRILYTGQKRITREENGVLYISFEQLDKWVTNKDKLGDYIDNITIVKQYKYAHRCVQRRYIGKPLNVSIDYNNEDNMCEDILPIENNELTILDLNEKHEYKGYKLINAFLCFKKFKNKEIVFPYVVIYNGSLSTDQIKELRNIYHNYINYNNNLNINYIVVFASSYDKKILDVIGNEFDYMIPISCNDKDYLSDLSYYIGLVFPKKNNFTNRISVVDRIVISDEIKICGFYDVEKRVNDRVELLERESNVKEDMDVDKYKNRIKMLLDSIG